ncbi:MAG: hypothetical protein ACPGOY_17145 [Rhodospirillaceae bacterium]
MSIQSVGQRRASPFARPAPGGKGPATGGPATGGPSAAGPASTAASTAAAPAAAPSAPKMAPASPIAAPAGPGGRAASPLAGRRSPIGGVRPGIGAGVGAATPVSVPSAASPASAGTAAAPATSTAPVAASGPLAGRGPVAPVAPVGAVAASEPAPRKRAARPEPKPRSQATTTKLEAIPRVLPGEADPKVNAVLRATAELSDMLRKENDALVSHDLNAISALAPTKKQLTRYYHDQMMAVKANPGLVLRLPEPQRKVMRKAAETMEAIANENGRLLKANINSHTKMVEAVVEAVKERQTKASTSYGGRGTLEGDPTQAHKLAVAYNKTL